MSILSVAQQAQVDSRIAGVIWLVSIDFKTGIQRYALYPTDLVISGFTWLGVSRVANVSGLAEKSNADIQNLDLTLSVADPALLGLAMSDPQIYQNRAVNLYAVITDGAGLAVGSPILRWSGKADTMAINVDGTNSGITLRCEPASMFLNRKNTAFLSHEQQQVRYMGDKGLEFVTGLVSKPLVWASAQFQRSLSS